MKVPYAKLYRKFMRDQHRLAYGTFFYVGVLVTTMLLFISILCICGIQKCESMEQAGTVFFRTSLYIVLIHLLPSVMGRINWKRYMFGALARDLSKEQIIKHMQKEHFSDRSVGEKPFRRFQESEHWFSFENFLVPKNLVEEVSVSFEKSSRGSITNMNFEILLSTGSLEKAYDVDAYGSATMKSGRILLKDYIHDFYRNRGYHDLDSKHAYSRDGRRRILYNRKKGKYTTSEVVSIDRNEENIWRLIEQ